MILDITQQINTRKQIENLNEELAAINEELAATNEELIVANEELAATNEELNDTNYDLTASNYALVQALQDIDKVFDRYFRVQNLQMNNISGFGIGLYLCAQIIERHNGQINAQSEPGKVSNFYFSLPTAYKTAQ